MAMEVKLVRVRESHHQAMYGKSKDKLYYEMVTVQSADDRVRTDQQIAKTQAKLDAKVDQLYYEIVTARKVHLDDQMKACEYKCLAGIEAKRFLKVVACWCPLPLVRKRSMSQVLMANSICR